jgi:hypothetical protein
MKPSRDSHDQLMRAEGEGESWSSRLLASPTILSDALNPAGLLAVSLLLAALLVGIITAATIG